MNRAGITLLQTLVVASAVFLAPQAALAQRTEVVRTAEFEPLTLSERGDVFGCGLRVFAVSSNRTTEERGWGFEVSMMLNRNTQTGMLVVSGREVQWQGKKALERKKPLSAAWIKIRTAQLDADEAVPKNIASRLGHHDPIKVALALGALARGERMTVGFLFPGRALDEMYEIAAAPSDETKRLLLSCIQEFNFNQSLPR